MVASTGRSVSGLAVNISVSVRDKNCTFSATPPERETNFDAVEPADKMTKVLPKNEKRPPS